MIFKVSGTPRSRLYHHVFPLRFPYVENQIKSISYRHGVLLFVIFRKKVIRITINFLLFLSPGIPINFRKYLCLLIKIKFTQNTSCIGTEIAN